jgi:uncharacterized protein (DUF427 family)
MKVVWNGNVIAEAPKEELIYIEGNWYFPPTSINKDYFVESDTPYTCPWKGVCQYFTITDGTTSSQDDAWSYPTPLPTAIERVKKDFSNYVAFWRSAQVEE